MKRYLVVLLALILMGCAPNLEGPFFVERVLDGDTIQIEGGTRIRFSGINTPEISNEDCYSKEAKSFVQQIEGKEVYLEKDELEKDKYGRSLRYVYYGEINLNLLLVEEGYAKAYHKFKDSTKYYNEIKVLENQAKVKQKGLWSCDSKDQKEITTINFYPWFTFPKILFIFVLLIVYILWNIILS